MNRKQIVARVIISGIISLVLITSHFFVADPLEFHGIHHIPALMTTLRITSFLVFVVSLIQFSKTAKTPN